MAYQPIEDYGVVGDLQTVALVGKNGSIDWMCYPHVDSPSVFAAILDDEKGGRFQIAPTRGDVNRKQMYLPDTNVLLTRFLSPDGVAEVTDYMPVGEAVGTHGHHQLIRSVATVRGSMRLRVTCHPAFDYARSEHRVETRPEGACFHADGLSLALTATTPLRAEGPAAVAEFELREGERTTFVLSGLERQEGCPRPISEEEADEAFQATLDFWQRWLAQGDYRGRWREMVHRSALALKLLTYEPTGAIVAAPTCSLPAPIGGGRNWDYRYTWVRDASFTLYGLMRIGFTEEAGGFMRWLGARVQETGQEGALQVMYSVDGRHELTEHTLDHLEGYRGSRPVRIGNAAHDQRQLDIYGELLDAVYLFNKHATPLGYDAWVKIRRILNHVCDVWSEPDEGIWEVRSGRQHFVYSKLMCWVALDRGLRLADKRSFPADHQRWLTARDAIYEEIMTRGWSEKRQAFVQAYGSETLDAANLIMPLVFFVSPTDPRFLSTLDAIQRDLTSGSLVHRYDVERSPDGLEGEEGTFSMCTFWLVEALTRAGRLPEARLVFERMLGYANHLGLYAEQVGSSGEAVGNFPQAFTHLGLISAAFNLDRALSGPR
ncbi:MAG: glycoside hydrolase family 15 protein [Acidobacteria bacterium]|jgi:GH15 family glucan-1,4-alpha-glucosidase|nr:glycoside hydrolase family 15 protein [Acidobacteriota bacterium]